MSKKSKYLDIKTLDELSAAIHGNRALIEAKGESVQTGLTRVQDFYTPRSSISSRPASCSPSSSAS